MTQEKYEDFVRALSLFIADQDLSIYLDVGEINANGCATIVIEVEPNDIINTSGMTDEELYKLF